MSYNIKHPLNHHSHHLMNNFTLHAHGKELSLATPQVMGILNLTPDSFYAGSRKQTEQEIAERIQQIITEGATIIDAGAMSTRPGGDFVSEDEEMRRMREGLRIVRREAPDAWLSVDTFRPMVARMAVEEFGADIINDVSEGGKTGLEGVPLKNGDFIGENSDMQCTDSVLLSDIPAIFREAGRLQVPYILMSVEADVEAMVSCWMREVRQLRDAGVSEIILDPGYGFGKDISQNYAILRRQNELQDVFRMPLLTGISRKRMIWQLLGTDADAALNGTTVVNTMALERGANILRVHDVRAAVEACRIVAALLGR